MQYLNKYISFIINFSFGAFILSFVLPSGYLFNIPIQKILFIFLILVFIVNIYNLNILRMKSKKNLFYLAHLIILFLSSFIWYVYGRLNGFEQSGQVLNGLLLPYIMFFISIIFYKAGNIDRKNIFRIIYITILLKIIGKIAVEILFIFSQDMDMINNIYINWFNTEVTTMGIVIGNLHCVRLMHSGDYLVIISSLYFMFTDSIVLLNCSNSKKISYIWRFVFILLVTLFVIIVYSRYIIIHYFILLVLTFAYFLFKVYNSNYTMKRKFLIFSVIAVILVIGIILAFPYLYELIIQRFFSVDSGISDDIRFNQTQIFNNNIMKKIFIGFGFGAYIPEIIRNTSNIFSYEKEYHSILYQMGIIGFLLIIVNMFYLYILEIQVKLRKLIKLKNIRWNNINSKFDCNVCIVLFTIVNIVFYLIRPLYNPGIFGFNNGIIFLIIFIILDYISEKGDNYEDFSSNSNV